MFNVLVLCTHNSARSILAEVLLNYYGQGLIQAYSAGSSPRPNQQPNPVGLQLLSERGHSILNLSSKSWDYFTQPNAPILDLVITVCDSAAGESCPLFIGTPLKVHWGYADPSTQSANAIETRLAFQATYDALERRIQALIPLATQATTAKQLQQAAHQVCNIK